MVWLEGHVLSVWKDHLGVHYEMLGSPSEAVASSVGGSEGLVFHKVLFPENGIESQIASSFPPPAQIVNYQNRVEVWVYGDTGRIRVSAASLVERQPATKKKVLIVDDSKTIQKLLTQLLGAHPELEVIGALDRPSEVEPFLLRQRPDVITLDIHMPEMDGVALLEQILPKFKIPTVMISSLSRQDGDYVFRALELGAVDYVQKPEFSDVEGFTLIREKVRQAADVRVQLRSAVSARVGVPNGFHAKVLDDQHLLAIGASTGGTEAIRALLQQFPREIPPILVVQHIPPVFSSAFAARLHQICPFEVKEASDGDEVKRNRVLIAPGGFQMKLVSGPNGYRVRVLEEPPVNRHRPSVDVLFESVAQLNARRSAGVILTGMGADGADGLLKMKDAGSITFGQDEASCVVYGMPRAAYERGAIDIVRPLEVLGSAILDQWTGRTR